MVTYNPADPAQQYMKEWQMQWDEIWNSDLSDQDKVNYSKDMMNAIKIDEPVIKEKQRQAKSNIWGAWGKYEEARKRSDEVFSPYRMTKEELDEAKKQIGQQKEELGETKKQVGQQKKELQFSSIEGMIDTSKIYNLGLANVLKIYKLRNQQGQ